jgi:hypothetical protein
MGFEHSKLVANVVGIVSKDSTRVAYPPSILNMAV